MIAYELLNKDYLIYPFYKKNNIYYINDTY